MLPTFAWADIELVAKIAPKNAGFTGMVDADQVLCGGGSGQLPGTCTVGGSGLVSASTCMNLSGVNTVYMGNATCIDSAESRIVQQVKSSTTLSNLQCRASADPGIGKSVSVTGRFGTCGSLSPSGTFTCSLTGGFGVPVCTAGAATMVVGDDQCWSLILQPGGVFTTKVAVNCTMEGT